MKSKMILLNKKLGVINGKRIKKQFKYNVFNKSNNITPSLLFQRCIIRALTFSNTNIIIRNYPSIVLNISYSYVLKKLKVLLVRKDSTVRLSLLIESTAFFFCFE